MVYTVDESITQKLLSLPETGMGYQLISAQVADQYWIKAYVVYNSQIFVGLDNNFSKSKIKISESLANFSANFSLEPLIIRRLNVVPYTINLIQRNEAYKLMRVHEGASLNVYAGNQHQSKGRHSGEKGAKDSPNEYADGKEIFVRLSAFENDKRIDTANRCLRLGTFTTTLNDYEDCVSYFDDPIDRYALPQEQAIKYAFHIQPAEKKDIFQRGIVQPAHQHSGGGIEAFFGYGTSPNTYLGMKAYGDINKKTN